MADWFGALEFHASGMWWCATRSDNILWSEKDLLGSLFGGTNVGNFRVLFPMDGAPHQLSYDFAKTVSELEAIATVDCGWVPFASLKEIDWEEAALAPEERLHRFRMLEDGSEVYLGKALSFGFPIPPDGIVGDERFRRVRLRRSDLLELSNFPMFLRIGDVLADRFGAENVRWVVMLAA